jgi:dipeptidyl aminopeptidase/acylaminoacyl peptidase
MWLMRRVDAPAPSPDGKWVVFSVTEPAYEEKDQSSDLWIVPADGSAAPRRLTQTKAGESGIAWTPDSRRFAFSAKRDADEAAQIYVLDVASGGEAIRITSLSTGASAPQISPDGTTLLFQSTVHAGAADDEANKKAAADIKARKYRARVYDSFPIRNWDRWLENTQRHVFVQPLETGKPARDLLAGTKLVATPGFGGVSGSSGHNLQPVWTPDSRSIVFTATVNSNEAALAQVRTDLYQVDASGGEPKKLTSGSGSYARPAFGPDGKALYATFEKHGDRVYNVDRLVRFAWPAMGAPSNLTAEFDRSVSSFTFSPDSKTIYLTAEDAGHEKLYSVPAAGGAVKPLGDLKSGCLANLASPSKAGTTVLFANFDSAVNPPEVVRLDAASGAQKLLTSFNVHRAAKLDLPPLRHFWFTSSRGKKIHSMVALPPGFQESKKYPLLVLMHGGPHSMWRDQWVTRWNYHLLAKPGYVVLLANYTGSTGYGEKFAQDIQGDPLAGPGQEINESADSAIKQFAFIDGSRQAAAGASYGGHLANWMQATTTRYKCLVSHAGLINLESQWGTSDTIYHRETGMGGPFWEGGKGWVEQNPIRFAAKFRTPMLVTVGENDFRVPLNQSLENWSVLQRMKVPSRLIVFPDENHWILKGENSRFFYQELHNWLAKWL